MKSLNRPACATVPNTAHSSFALSYRLRNEHNPFYCTAPYIQDFAKGGARWNQTLTFLQAEVGAVSSARRLGINCCALNMYHNKSDGKYQIHYNASDIMEGN